MTDANHHHPVARAKAMINAWLDAYTTRRAMVPAYLVLAVGLTAALVIYDDLVQQRSEDAVAVARSISIAQCESRVDARTGLRLVLTAIIDEFPTTENGERIRAVIERDLPEITITECEQENQP